MSVLFKGDKPVTFQCHYQSIENVKLSDAVFPDIKVQFETAKNAYLYSWFSFRLGMLAWSHAYSTLELTLRLAAETQGFKIRTLTRLLEKAEKESWIDFSKFVRTQTVSEYIEIQANFRNDMSHGTHTVLPPEMILPFLEDCVEMINQIFDNNLLTNTGSSILDGWC